MAICNNKQYEREFVRMMNAEGHLCMRVAGSGQQASAVCDCVLFKEGKVYLVEVKATKENKLYLRKTIKNQIRKLCEVALDHKIIPLLAIKRKYKGWELQELEKV